MAQIKLHNIAHSYSNDDDWALKPMDITFEDGGAYALLGPSGCGKTTLLNIISGIIQPTEGRLHFGMEDVTELPPQDRHIAQIFQFPVIYDTMSVYDNLAFPLKNRAMQKAAIHERVHEIAALTDLTPMLHKRASSLSADEKQKISLARGLVRSDVNVIMLDEPLTSIDPGQKWKLRSKLKELHQMINVTMIYVTHDQTEALTFADKVVVMNFGEILQIGTPIELFNQPNHAFVGYFIGSPGMNFIDCMARDKQIYIGDTPIKTANNLPRDFDPNLLKIGIRPEFISVKDKVSDKDIMALVKNSINVGKNYLLDIELTNSGQIIKIVSQSEPADKAIGINLAQDYCYLYHNGYLV